MKGLGRRLERLEGLFAPVNSRKQAERIFWQFVPALLRRNPPEESDYPYQREQTEKARAEYTPEAYFVCPRLLACVRWLHAKGYEQSGIDAGARPVFPASVSPHYEAILAAIQERGALWAIRYVLGVFTIAEPDGPQGKGRK